MRGKILVVVNKATIRTMVESLLKEYNFEVFCFEESQKGLDWLMLSKVDLKVDLIILDYSLPEPSVFTICQKIRQSQKFANIPAIILLTLEEMRDAEALKRAGASDFMIKPFNPQELMEKVEIYLLEKAATSSQDISTSGINHTAKPADKLGELFASEGALDLDSILSEGRSAKDSSQLEDLLRPAGDELEIQRTPSW